MTKQTTRSLRLPLIIAVTALLLFAAASLAAAAEPGLNDLTAVVAEQTILPTQVEGETWFLLPSHTDLHALRLCFTPEKGASVRFGDGEPVDASAELDVVALAGEADEQGAYALPYTVSSPAGETAGTLRFMKTENVGTMFLSVADPAYGRNWVDCSPDHSNDAAKQTTVTMQMLTADADVVYNGKLTSLKGRGNTTWATSAKKPYQIKLDKKTNLLPGTDAANKNKTWVLLANALDKTLFKNALAFDLARVLELGETPEYTFVNLYFDGEYRGLYQLAEKVQINPGRVEIGELEAHNTVADETAAARGVNSMGLEYQYNPTAVCDTDEISGGYLLEQDAVFYASENSWFRLSDGSAVVVKSPEFCTKEQMEYISVRFNQALLAAQNDVYDGASVTELFDLDSLAALYMVNEYTKNCDFTASSTYFFLPEPGNPKYAHKFYAGPAWDFDTSLGNRTELDWMREPTGLFRASSPMFHGSLVRSAVKEKAKTLAALSGVLFAEAPTRQGSAYSLSWYRAFLDPAQKMNYKLWQFDDTVNTFAKPTYEENYAYVYGFLQARHADILPRIAAWKTPDYAAVKNCCAGLHSVESRDVLPTCTAAGQTGRVCGVCGQVLEPITPIPATGHADGDGDEVCDRCGAYLGEVPSLLQRLLAFFRRLTEFWRNLFRFGR